MNVTRTPPHLPTLVFLTALSVLTLNMFLPSLPVMTRDFAATEALMGVAVSGYMLAAAVMQLVLGPLSDRVGRRPVLLVALTIYVLSSVGCFVAQSVEVFIVFRLMQSVVIGGSVLSSAAIRDLYPPNQAAARMGTVGAAMALAPMIGPTLGGLLDTLVGWRAIFGLYTGIGIGLLILTYFDFGETRHAKSAPSSLDEYLALIAARRFWAFALCMSFTVGAFYVFITGVPFVALQTFDLGSAQVGIGIGSITGGFMLGSTLTSRFTTRFGLVPMILAGRFAALAGVLGGISYFGFGMTHPLGLFGATILVGFGNGLTMANAYAGAMSVRPALAGTAAGLAGALGVAIGAGLTSISLLLLSTGATPLRLLTLMLICVGASLIFALSARRHQIRAAIS